MEGHKIIKAMRIYLGMSQREAAEKLGIYLSVYQKYENIPGFVMRANFTRVCKILEFMHLDPNKFFMERYELTEAGYEVTARETTGSPTNQQKGLSGNAVRSVISGVGTGSQRSQYYHLI